MNIGDQIKYNRKQNNLSQEALGKILGVGKQTIAKYEKGVIQTIPSDKIKKMACLFDISPAQLLCLNSPLDELLYAISRKSTDEDLNFIRTYLNLDNDWKRILNNIAAKIEIDTMLP